MAEPVARRVGAEVRRLRVTAGLSQGQLAVAAGVSRQAVSALESGLHLPRVDAAVALAQVLGTTAEALLAEGSQQPVGIDGGALPEGAPVRLARVGEVLVGLPVASPASGEGLAAPDAVVTDGVAVLFEGAVAEGFVVVGCDPALGMLPDLGPAGGAGRLLIVPGTTATAKQALLAGRVHAALVHGATVGRAPAGVRRLGLASWRTGLAAPPGTDAIAEALTGRGRVVQREDGAAAQRSYVDALARRGHAPPETRVLARGHLDAGRRALETGAAAVTIEPVAHVLGLAFHPLETHVAELWLAPDASEHPGGQALGQVLSSARFRGRLRALPGYDLEGAA